MHHLGSGALMARLRVLRPEIVCSSMYAPVRPNAPRNKLNEPNGKLTRPTNKSAQPQPRTCN